VLSATYNWYWNGCFRPIWRRLAGGLGFGSTGATNFPSISFGPKVNGFDTASGIWQGHYWAPTLILGDQVSWTKGRHTMTFGGDFGPWSQPSGSDALSFNFSNVSTGA
jgi:hypothetical protein